jgi:glutamate 5-kinase
MEKVIDDVLVIKVGTSTLIEKDGNGSEQLDIESFKRIGRQLIQLKDRGEHIAIVSSAAITAGMVATGLSVRPQKGLGMPSLQRLASIGWRHVLNAWSEALGDEAIGELLLTKNELDHVRERQEAVSTVHCLMRSNNIAVINENDAITHDQIAIGDNDTLAANFATRLKGSRLFGGNVRLVILSDINGVRKDVNDPNTVIREIRQSELHRYGYLAGGSGSLNGTGGMITKFKAAKISLEGGVDMWVANGREDNVVDRALSGETGTHFTV